MENRNSQMTVKGGAHAPMQCTSLHFNLCSVNSSWSAKLVHREISSLQLRRLQRSGNLSIGIRIVFGDYFVIILVNCKVVLRYGQLRLRLLTSGRLIISDCKLGINGQCRLGIY